MATHPKASIARSPARSTPATGTPGRALGQAKGAAGGAAPLSPIRRTQKTSEIIATVADATGFESGVVARVARSLSQTLTRHLIRGGSGRVEIPYLGAALWRGRTAAQKARRMTSPILNGRTVTVKERPAQAAPRLRAHRPLRDLVART